MSPASTSRGKLGRLAFVSALSAFPIGLLGLAFGNTPGIWICFGLSCAATAAALALGLVAATSPEGRRRGATPALFLAGVAGLLLALGYAIGTAEFN